jgi:DNA-binding NarL/FixJ family response regulator
MRVLADSASAAEALRLCREHRPDLILLDLNLAGGTGMAIAKDALALSGRVIVLTSREDEATILELRHLGVQGFLHKRNASSAHLQQAIADVRAGRRHFDETYDKVSAATAKPGHWTKLLTRREQEVLPLLGQGLPDSQIAAMLGLAVSTAHNHRRNIMFKLDVHDVAELIGWCRIHGFGARD